jgi:hypothetical protein
MPATLFGRSFSLGKSLLELQSRYHPFVFFDVYDNIATPTILGLEHGRFFGHVLKNFIVIS